MRIPENSSAEIHCSWQGLDQLTVLFKFRKKGVKFVAEAKLDCTGGGEANPL